MQSTQYSVAGRHVDKQCFPSRKALFLCGVVVLLSSFWQLPIHQYLPLFSSIVLSNQNDNPVPVVDISAFLEGRDDETASQQLAGALTNLGVVRVKGLRRELSHFLGNFRQLFALDLQSKAWSEGVLNRGDGFIRGYIPMGRESGLSDVFEIKEGFCYGYGWEEGKPQDNPLQGPNMWPKDVPRHIKDGLAEWYDFSIKVAEAVARGLAQALGKESHYFEDMCQESKTISIMRLFRYLNPNHIDKSIAPGKPRLGSSPHRDWHLLTVILQDGSHKVGGGLEIKKGHAWWPVDTDADELLILGGEYLSLISYGQFLAPVHRVTLPPADIVDRVSGVFFYYPNFDSVLSPTDVTRAQLAVENDPGQANSLVSYLLKGGSCAGCSFGELMLAKWAAVLNNTNT